MPEPHSLIEEEFHDVTKRTSGATTVKKRITKITSRASSSFEDVQHDRPLDRTKKHVWLFEPPTADGVLTKDGVTQIAYHEYKPGTYTVIDNLCNPAWSYLTERLPMWLAPNLVTAIGGLHCLAAYVVAWYLTPNFDVVVPWWVLLVNAYCIAAYYTLDCMDGKQARRTASSSPLGQLFDHGVDCLCIVAHISCMNTWIWLGGTLWFFAYQCSLQFCFFAAQWEEYHTGVLPHAKGQVGVTEVNYGLAVANLFQALFVNTEAFYTTTVEQILRAAAGSSVADAAAPSYAGALELRHFLALFWIVCLIVLSSVLIRHTVEFLPTSTGRLSALAQLLSPLALCAVPFVLPHRVIRDETRYVHLTVGIALSLISIKMVVFSMSKQAYAVVQGDAIPAVVLALWTRYDPRLLPPGVHLAWQIVSLWYCYRLVYWTRAAIRQICARLQINLFSIRPKK